MAYVNVSEWRAEQVAEWLQGLDDSIHPHAHSFLNNNVSGRQLLNVTVDDLYRLQVEKVGHQEIILEALDDLRNLHHNLDVENLQYVCLKLSCKARSLANEIRMYGPDPDEAKQSVSTAVMSSVADVTDALRTVTVWLGRPPFLQTGSCSEALVRIGIELTTTAWRDTFAERPVNKIRDCCTGLADLSDRLITDADDPLVLQPASLDVATVRRRANDDDDQGFGIVLRSTMVVAEVRFQSAAHRCGRVHPGDQVVQVNYQTVVGWTLNKVVRLMAENPSELILTLKKPPRHLPPLFGQIYVKPFRIPGRKCPNSFFNNLPSSPRAELLVAPSIVVMQRRRPHQQPDDDDRVSSAGSEEEEEDGFLRVSSSSSLVNDDKPSPTRSVRSLLLSRTRSAPMRRATISGSSPSSHARPYINVSEVWSCQARNVVQSLDQQQPITSSNTLRSDDSGTATMSSSNTSPPAIDDGSEWDSHATPLPKAPMPMPRTQLPAAAAAATTNHPSPSGKRPIPQPRRGMANLQILSTPTPNKVQPSNGLDTVCPVPTSEFQSFRKVTTLKEPAKARHPAPADLPEYVNTTPPEVPARNQPPPSFSGGSSGSIRTPSELLRQQTRRPSSRRFFVEPEEELPHPPARSSTTTLLGNIQRRSSMESCNSFSSSVGSCSDVDSGSSKRSGIIHHNRLVEEEEGEDQQSIPYYYVSDVIGGKELMLSQPPPELPPPFSPSTYSMQQEELRRQRNVNKLAAAPPE